MTFHHISLNHSHNSLVDYSIRPFPIPDLTVRLQVPRALQPLAGYYINFFCFTDTKLARQEQFNPLFDLAATPQPDLVITQTSPTKNQMFLFFSSLTVSVLIFSLTQPQRIKSCLLVTFNCQDLKGWLTQMTTTACFPHSYCLFDLIMDLYIINPQNDCEC